MKKSLSLFTIVAITVFASGLMSYVRAAFVEPAGAPDDNNNPAPVLLSDTNKAGFVKIGKLGITKDLSTSPVETAAFDKNTLVVAGQLAADSLASNGDFNINAELETNSTLSALFVGDPTQNSFMQTNPDSSPKTFLVTGHTRAPRLVAGSKGAPAGAYNLYLAEGSNATNLGKNNEYCTLTKAQLQNQGCPSSYSYRTVNVGTYLGQVIVTNGSSSSDIVASCYVLTPSATQNNLGSCY